MEDYVNYKLEDLFWFVFYNALANNEVFRTLEGAYIEAICEAKKLK